MIYITKRAQWEGWNDLTLYFCDPYMPQINQSIEWCVELFDLLYCIAWYNEFEVIGDETVRTITCMQLRTLLTAGQLPMRTADPIGPARIKRRSLWCDHWESLQLSSWFMKTQTRKRHPSTERSRWGDPADCSWAFVDSHSKKKYI